MSCDCDYGPFSSIETEVAGLRSRHGVLVEVPTLGKELGRSDEWPGIFCEFGGVGWKRWLGEDVEYDAC